MYDLYMFQRKKFSKKPWFYFLDWIFCFGVMVDSIWKDGKDCWYLNLIDLVGVVLTCLSTEMI